MMENKLDLIKQIKQMVYEDIKFKDLEFVRMEKNFGIVLTFNKPVSVSGRGTVLLDFEELLIKRIDSRLRVWCEIAHDKSKLRKLRGLRFET